MKRINNLIILFIFGCCLINPTLVFAKEKTETIFTSVNASGEVKSTSVSVHLKKIDTGDVLDTSLLNNIHNDHGDETFSKDSKGLIWKSSGKDIFYSGKITKELPIKINPHYYLNGEEVTYSKLKGSKGSIKIVFNLENNKYDANSSLYTPFVVTMGMILKGDSSKVEVSNGKVVSTGEKTIVTSVASPGIYKSLGFEELRNLDTITITFDTKKFEDQEIYFISTPKLLDSIDINKFNIISSISSSLNTLQNGMNELENGSNSLYNGAVKLKDGSIKLSEGILNAYKGSLKITEGLTQVEEGSNKLSSLTTLVTSLYQKYNENNQLLDNIMSGVPEAELKKGISDAQNKVEELENKLIAVKSGIKMLEELQKTTELNEEQLAQLNTLKNNEEQLEYGISEYKDGISKAENTLKELSFAPSKISGANEVISQVLMGILGVNSMDLVESQIELFTNQINTLLGGISSLREGSNTLTNGLDQLSGGSLNLTEGTSSLEQGSNQLKNGIHKVNSEGINKLSNYGNEINYYTNKIKSLVNLSKNYSGFSSNDVNMSIFVTKLSIK